MYAVGLVALTGLAWALAYWDVGRRRVDSEREVNEKLAADFGAKLTAHQETYKTALNRLILDMQQEIDSMSAEVTASVTAVSKAIGRPTSGNPEPWQQAGIDERARLRRKHEQRRNTTT